MAIRVTGMYSGLDTESIISELVSAKSIKKQNLVKGQIKLSWKQDAWKALNTKIYNFYTNVLSDMRYQGSYTKKTTKVSNSSAIKVVTSDSAVDGVRKVKVNEVARGANLTSRNLESSDGIRFTGYATLKQLRKYSDLNNSANLSGSFRVMGEQGQYLDFEVNEDTTINDVVKMIKSTGLNCNYDEDSQRIFISSKKTGAANNFYIMANDEGGLNALAALGLLSADDIENNAELKKWASYTDENNKDAYDKRVDEEIKERQAAYKEANDKLQAANDKLSSNNEDLEKTIKNIFDAMDENDYLSSEYKKKYGESLSDVANKLYGEDGLYDELQAAKEKLREVKGDESSSEEDIADAQAAYDLVKKSYDDTKKQVDDFINDIVYGPEVEKKDENGEVVKKKVQKVDENGNPMFEQVVKKDENGDDVKDDEGNLVYVNGDPIYEEVAVMVREGGLKKEYEESTNPSDELKANVASVNKWYDAMITLEQSKSTLTSNDAKIAANEAKIADNAQYLTDDVDPELGMSKIESQVRKEFDARAKASKDTLDALNEDSKYRSLFGSKVNAKDAEIEIDGAKFTSMTNSFSVNGLTLTVNEVTDKEITITTSTDTDGIYDMIKNLFKEYNALINEMNSLYNAESSSGYEPLTSEEKEALTESEVEEWEKKIKDSLLRHDSTLSSVSYAMMSVFLQGVAVDGKQMYLSDFGINTLGYFVAAENERNAYHIDGDPDDDATKANDDVLKRMIASDPDTVMKFFSKIANNMYDTLTTQMASTTMSSAFTVYNDKQMKNEYNDYADKIAKEEEKLNALMDKWYSKFSKMETALAKLESRSGSLASMLGG